jgi:WD40 repeat protein
MSCWQLSPDSRLLVAHVGGGRVFVEELLTGARRVLTTEVRDAYGLALHPNQPLAALAQWNDKGVAVISLTNGAVCARYPVPGGAASVAWDPAGSLLAAGCVDSIVRVWNWPGDDKPIHLLRRHKAEVVNLKFHPSGLWLLSQGWDDQNCLWNLEDAHLAMVLPGMVNGFSADGTRLAMQHLGKVIEAEFEGAVQPRTITAHQKGKSPMLLAISPDGRRLVTAGYDGAWLWTTTNWQSSRRLWAGQAISAGFSQTPQRVYVVGRDKWRAWELSDELASGDELSPASLPWRQAAGEVFKGIVEPCSGRWLSLEWNASRSRPVLRTGLVHDSAAREVALDDNSPADLALSPDGCWAACGNWHGQDTWVVDLSTNKAARRLPHAGNATVEFTPDSRYLVIGGRNGFRFLKTDTWEQRFVISRDAPDQMAGKIRFAQHLGLAALHASRSRIRLVRWEDGKEDLTLTTPEERHLSAFTFTPDDRYLVVASPDHHLLVWDLEALNARMETLGLFEASEGSATPKAATETRRAVTRGRELQ